MIALVAVIDRSGHSLCKPEWFSTPFSLNWVSTPCYMDILLPRAISLPLAVFAFEAIFALKPPYLTELLRILSSAIAFVGQLSSLL